MANSRVVRRRPRLPGRAALLLGLGALSAAGPAAAEGRPRDDGGALIRSDGGSIFLSEGGRETELRLGATPQRDRLLRLLEEHGPEGVRLDPDPRLIMSGGGGSGFSLWDVQKSVTGKPAPGSQDPPPATAPRGSRKQGTAPREAAPAAAKKG